jgi:prolyl-tRNA editing enzyme YbaK/EbsC (Cys-tRNA(Pro) deacylase)
MPPTAVQRFTARAEERGLQVEVREFPDGTRTAADAAAAIGCDVAQIVKSLVFVAGDGPVLALTSGANRVDERKLADHLGVDTVRKADATEVRAATGYAIGGTPPFGHDTDLTVVCDRSLTDHDELWAAAGSPTTVFPLTPATLLATTGAATVDLA